jgi:hypothetical protein
LTILSAAASFSNSADISTPRPDTGADYRVH